MQLETDFNNQRLLQLIQRAKIGSHAALTHIRMKEAITVMATICQPYEQGKWLLGTITEGYEFLLTLDLDAVKTEEDLDVILADFMDRYHAKKVMAEAALSMMCITLLRLHFKALVLPWLTSTTQATKNSLRHLRRNRAALLAMSKADFAQTTTDIAQAALQIVQRLITTSQEALFERLAQDLKELQDE